MRRQLLDVLACPIDKHYPLRLLEFETQGDIIKEGVLLCGECNRYYPIADEIPTMLPDELRNAKEDIAFLTKWREKLPPETVAAGRPHNLSS